MSMFWPAEQTITDKGTVLRVFVYETNLVLASKGHAR